MANILHIEDDFDAVESFRKILKRGSHEAYQVDSVEEGWKMLLENVNYDLLVMEIKLQSENAWSIIRRIKSNPFLSNLPVIAYSRIKDKRLVRSITDMDVQNYLYKPYREKLLNEEIEHATEKDWRIHLAGNHQLFYSRTKVNLVEFHKSNVELTGCMETLHKKIKGAVVSGRQNKVLRDDITSMIEMAEWQDYTVYSKFLEEFLKIINSGVSSKINHQVEYLQNAMTLQRYRQDYLEVSINDNMKKSASDVVKVEDEYDLDSDKKKYSSSEIEEKIRSILNYPVIESAVDSFQVISDDVEVSMGEIVKVIERDPGLATAVLQFSNSSFVAPASVIEDIHQAISVLGLMRVRLMAMSLRKVSEMGALFSAFRWQDFWVHQVGCAMISEFIFTELDLPGRSQIAYLGGLIHDIGKLLLCEVDSETYKKAVSDSAKKDIPLSLCELEYFSCSHAHAGLIFAKQNNFSPTLQNAIAFNDKVEEVKEDIEIVGCVAVANYLCMKFSIGNNGDRTPLEIDVATSHPAWELFSPWLSPSFDADKFNKEIEIKVKRLRIELMGLASRYLE